MNPHYEIEFEKKIVCLYLEEGRTLKGPAEEYRVSEASISNWVSQFREECQTNEEAQADYDYMKENLRLRKELAELQKENDFSKKSGGILYKGNRLEAYRFIRQYGSLYGIHWLLKRFGISPNAYYNFLKNRKSGYHKRKVKIQTEITNIYHKHGGVDGYRTMHAYLCRKGINIRLLTTHKYMNTELQLFSIVRKKKPGHEKGSSHKVFENKLNQDFTAKESKSGVQISHICFLQMEVSVITVPSLICMAEALLPVSQISISPVNWRIAHCRKHGTPRRGLVQHICYFTVTREASILQKNSRNIVNRLV